MKKLVLILAIVCLAGIAHAGNPLGVRAGLATSPDQVVLGGQMLFRQLDPNSSIVPNVEISFGDDITIYSFNGAYHYGFSSSNMNGFTPYVGGELGLNMFSWDVPTYNGTTFTTESTTETKFVVNGVAGLSKKLDQKKELFFEFKLGLSDWANDIKVLAGLNFF